MNFAEAWDKATEQDARDRMMVLGHTPEEIDLLIEHDRDEELHEYINVPDIVGNSWECVECGDTAEGLMHNNTYRNVEPLEEDHYMSEAEYRRDQAERSGNSSANWGFTVEY